MFMYIIIYKIYVNIVCAWHGIRCTTSNKYKRVPTSKANGVPLQKQDTINIWCFISDEFVLIHEDPTSVLYTMKSIQRSEASFIHAFLVSMVEDCALYCRLEPECKRFTHFPRSQIGSNGREMGNCFLSKKAIEVPEFMASCNEYP